MNPTPSAPSAPSVTPRPLRALLIEDTPDDALLLLRALKKAGFAPQHERVDGAAALRQALAAGPWDIAISDYTMPGFGALQALEIVRQHDADLPFIIVSGNIGEEVAVGAMRAGAQDYLLKHNLARLGPVVTREVDEAAMRRGRGEAESRLASQQARMNDILGALGDMVWSIGLPELRMSFVNAAAAAILDRPASELPAALEDWLDIIHPGDREAMRAYAGDTLRRGANSAEFRILRPDGEVRWLFDRARLITDDAGHKLRIDGIASDITQHKQSQEQLYRAAHYDALTGLPNRKLMAMRLHQELAAAGASGVLLALLFIDFDRLKTINDSLGHNAGDIVLAELAERMRGALREEDTIARIGGDEFVVILPEIRHEDAVEGVLGKLAAAIAPPIAVGANTIHSTASIGVALFPRDGADGETLLKNADTAMYAAKRAGRNAWRFYTAAMNAASVGLLALENDLRGALERDELELYYQPQVDLARGGIISGFEALLRWNHPARGLVSPLDFIPLAEETGLIVPIGEWVLHQACRQAARWVEEFDPSLRMAVNLSARQFAQPGLAQTVAAALEASGLSARNLELELTESMLMHDPEQAGQVLAGLKAMGVTLAVDDFGTGYSSLTYLRRFPIDVLKIDRSFVGDLVAAPDDAAICASIIAMAHSLRLKVVAEGVETESQLGFLARRGCDSVQGYLIGKPQPAAKVQLKNTLRLGLRTAASDESERVLLLVDDDEFVLAALQRLLRHEGYRILAAASAAAGFELLAKQRVDVIVTDQRMPLMNGNEFLRRVKDLYPNVIRIMLSGYTELDSVIDSINTGAIYRFLTKPWDDGQLRAAIREAFARQELQRENLLLGRQYRDAVARLAELEGRGPLAALAEDGNADSTGHAT